MLIIRIGGKFYYYSDYCILVPVILTIELVIIIVLKRILKKRKLQQERLKNLKKLSIDSK